MTQYICDLCGWQSAERAAALEHVASEHGIAEPVEVGQVEQQAGMLYLRSGDSETVIDMDAWIEALIASETPVPADCPHPASRRYAWFARDDSAPGGQALCVACSDCGAVLQCGASPVRARTSDPAPDLPGMATVEP